MFAARFVPRSSFSFSFSKHWRTRNDYENENDFSWRKSCSFEHCLIALAIAAGGTAPLAHAATAPTPRSALHTLTFSGDQKQLEALDAEIAAAGTDPAKLEAIATRLLESLRRSDSTFAGRQAICQRLGLVLAQTAPKADADAYKPLGTMLADERDADLARLALENARGPVVDTMLTTALGKTTGATRIGLIGSLGRRRAESAVAALAKLVQEPDAKTAAAAVRALGDIGTSAAVTALRGAPPTLAADVISAKIAATKRLPGAEGVTLLREVQADRNAPKHLRAAALRASLRLQPNAATDRIIEALNGSDDAFKRVALEAIADVTTSGVVPALVANLASWDAPSQAAVIAALARRGDPAAASAVFAASSHASAEVRSAAIAALGFFPGNRDVAMALARAAAGDSIDDARNAKQSLARLTGPDVASTVLAGAERGDSKLRAVYLEQLALRNMTEGLALLFKARTDPDLAVRTAAVAALGDIAPLSDLQKLIYWTIAATEESEQSRALRSVVNVTLRSGDLDRRAQPLYAAIEKASPEVAVRLMPALTRIGGKASAVAAARMATRDDAKVSDAAVSALTRWTDHTALEGLVTAATKAPAPAARTAALDGVFRSFDRYREPWTAATTGLVAELFASTKDTAARKRLLKLLNRADDAAALKLVQANRNDAELGPVAAYAAAVIAANRAGPPSIRTSINPTSAANLLDGKTSTRWTTSTLGEEWFEIDFKISRPIQRITLDQTGRAADFPEHYEVYVTDDPNQLGRPRKSGPGQRLRTTIELPADVSGRYLVIRNTRERVDGLWSVCEAFVE